MVSNKTPTSTSQQDDLQTPTPDTDAAITIQRGLTNFSGIEALTPSPRHFSREEEEERGMGKSRKQEAPCKARGDERYFCLWVRIGTVWAQT